MLTSALHDWIGVNKLKRDSFSGKPNAIHLIEENIDEVNWGMMSTNPSAIHVLKKN